MILVLVLLLAVYCPTHGIHLPFLLWIVAGYTASRIDKAIE